MSSRRYAVFGAFLGMGLVVLGTVLEAMIRHGALPFGEALLAAQASPMLWLVDLAPLVLGVLAALAARRHVEVMALEAARRERFEHTAGELLGSAQALLSAVASFSSMTIQTADSVRQTISTMEQIGHTATEAVRTAETVVGLTRASRAALGEVHRAVLPAASAIAAPVVAAGPSMQKLASTIEESSGAARAIAQMATQQDRRIDQVLKALNELYLATAETLASTQAMAVQVRALNELASDLRETVQA